MKPEVLSAELASSISDLEKILALQKLYLKGVTSAEEEKDQGFLTVEHNLDLLKKMHDANPSIIVKDNGVLAGYALTMPSSCRNLVPVLFPMFESLDDITYRGKPVSTHDYYVMGQICVAKEYRGKGIFDLLYQGHKKFYEDKYDLLVTEVSFRNMRSYRAHERVGFSTIHEYQDETDHWALMVWDWRA
jgi:GNAT superfamily N-acetyltransferase